MCDVGYIYVNVWGKDYHIPLYDVPYVYTLRPLPWQYPTTFYLKEYNGAPPLWTQYHPFYHKQEGGLEFTYPGGHSGEEFTLYIRTECGEVAIMTDVDDPTPTPPPVSTPVTGWVPLMTSNFDNGSLGAIERSGNPTWGVASCEASSAPNSLWPAAWGRAARDACEDDYPNGAESWAVLGPFDFSNATNAEATFDYLLQTEQDHDWFAWYASEDGQSFSGLRESGDSHGWAFRTFDLSYYAGKSDVWLAFVFTSDDNGITDKGVFLDNLVVRKFVNPAPPRGKSMTKPLVMAPESGETLESHSVTLR